MPTDMKGRSVLSNLLAVATAEVVARMAQVVAISIISRSLGPAGLAIVGTAWAFYNMALPLVQFSPEIMGVRAIGRNRRRLSVIGEINLLSARSRVGYVPGGGADRVPRVEAMA